MSMQDKSSAGYARKVNISCAGNLRDLGGYRNTQGQQVVWRRIFRSGELKHRSVDDVHKLKQATGVKAVLDLRGSLEIKDSTRQLLAAGGVQYRNIPLVVGSGVPGAKGNEELLSRFNSIGEFYLYQMGQEMFGSKLVQALEFVAEHDNQPVIFHCALGKDRTGILSAALLSILGVPEKVIIEDYFLTTEYMTGFKAELKADPQGVKMLESVPGFLWDAPRESMALMLNETKRQYGSFMAYLQFYGGKLELWEKLKKSFLE
jgi:protein-tyrosine phosphatase